jgi:hypothetical protein
VPLRRAGKREGIRRNDDKTAVDCEIQSGAVGIDQVLNILICFSALRVTPATKPNDQGDNFQIDGLTSFWKLDLININPLAGICDHTQDLTSIRYAEFHPFF